MAKMPAFQFYPGDWVQDTCALSLAAKGGWIDILCALWRSQNRGSLTLSALAWARVMRCSIDQANTIINELVSLQICDCVRNSNGDVTLSNRRMLREERSRENARIRVQKKRDKDGVLRTCNANVTPPSSSSSSKKENIKRKNFQKPAVKDIEVYANSIDFTHLDCQKFWDYYEAKGWVVGRSPMKDWKAAVRTWKSNSTPHAVKKDEMRVLNA